MYYGKPANANEVIYWDGSKWTVGAPSYFAVGTTPASVGMIRIPKQTGLWARNDANDNDVELIGMSPSNVLLVGGPGTVGGATSPLGIIYNTVVSHTFSVANVTKMQLAATLFALTGVDARLDNAKSLRSNNGTGASYLTLVSSNSSNFVLVGQSGTAGTNGAVAGIIYDVASTGYHAVRVGGTDRFHVDNVYAELYNTPLRNFATATDGNGAQFWAMKSRGGGTAAAALNDLSLDMSMFAHDGTGYVQTAAFVSRIDGAVSTGVVPLNLEFYTGSTSLTMRYQISSAGVHFRSTVGTAPAGNPSGGHYIWAAAATGVPTWKTQNGDTVQWDSQTAATAGAITEYMTVTFKGNARKIALYAV